MAAIGNREGFSLWLMNRLFPQEIGLMRLAIQTFVASLLALFAVLALFVLKTPVFLETVTQDRALALAVMRQVMASGLPIVFVINLVGFSNFGAMAHRHDAERGAAATISMDLLTRGFLFFALHALSYYLAAVSSGSFGGDPATALRVVAPTLAGAALFANLAGVYLYATAVSALPFLMLALAKAARDGGRFGDPVARAAGGLGAERRPRTAYFLISLAVFLAFALAVSAVARVMAVVVGV
jgi:hypothetical protein